jgi:BirA family biotin operon repressor/biotin-[acetyl-CoA-carboxylase] ligase
MDRKRKAAIDNENIVSLLKENTFTSGAEIADALKVTRAAVWKRIGLLRNKGYTIEASPAKGYRLIKSPDLSIDELKKYLSGQPKIIGSDILFFESIDSTNITAMKLAEKGCAQGTVIIADGQTQGKGRLGRTWLSPKGKNLYMSIILRPEIPLRDATVLTLMSAVACASAIKRLFPIPVSIKWPNDIMASDKKLGGILTEIKADIDRILYAVIGIGINVNFDIADMPDEIKTTATSIKIEQKGRRAEVQNSSDFSRTLVAIEIIKELDRWYSILLNSGKNPIIENWLRLSSTIGRTVRVTVRDNVFTGVAELIDDEGMLILKLPDNSFKKISAGDVSILR